MLVLASSLRCACTLSLSRWRVCTRGMLSLAGAVVNLIVSRLQTHLVYRCGGWDSVDHPSSGPAGSLLDLPAVGAPPDWRQEEERQ